MVNAVRAALPYVAVAAVVIGALNFIWFFFETPQRV